MHREAQQIVWFMRLAEALKRELRHSWCSDGRRESVAEHTWQMALLAVLVHRHLAVQVDLGRALELVLVHDLVEAVCGDVPFFDDGERRRMKAVREREAIVTIRGMLPEPTASRVHDLWHEFEDGVTAEARFARALDHLEVQIQHNLADLATWEPIEHALVYTKMDGPCAHDGFLVALCEAVKAQAEAKMAAGGIDVAAVRAAAG